MTENVEKQPRNSVTNGGKAPENGTNFTDLTDADQLEPNEQRAVAVPEGDNLPRRHFGGHFQWKSGPSLT